MHPPQPPIPKPQPNPNPKPKPKPMSKQFTLNVPVTPRATLTLDGVSVHSLSLSERDTDSLLSVDAQRAITRPVRWLRVRWARRFASKVPERKGYDRSTVEQLENECELPDRGERVVGDEESSVESGAEEEEEGGERSARPKRPRSIHSPEAEKESVVAFREEVSQEAVPEEAVSSDDDDDDESVEVSVEEEDSRERVEIPRPTNPVANCRYINEDGASELVQLPSPPSLQSLSDIRRPAAGVRGTYGELQIVATSFVVSQEQARALLPSDDSSDSDEDTEESAGVKEDEDEEDQQDVALLAVEDPDATDSESGDRDSSCRALAFWKHSWPRPMTPYPSLEERAAALDLNDSADNLAARAVPTNLPALVTDDLYAFEGSDGSRSPTDESLPTTPLSGQPGALFSLTAGKMSISFASVVPEDYSCLAGF